MKYLIEAARQYGLSSIAEQAMQYPNVHGVIVDLHPFWLSLWKLHLTQPDKEITEDLFFEWYRHRFLGPADIENISHPDVYFNTTVPIDIHWYPSFWKHYFKHSNLIAKILLKPGSPSIEIKSEGRLLIVQEHCPVPKLAANAKKVIRPLEGGVSIGHLADPPGTLGGILHDPANGWKYALTCGHVIRKGGFEIDQPSRQDNPSDNVVGFCVYSHSPTPSGNQLCNQYNTDILNEMDIALIELEGVSSSPSIINVGAVQGFTPHVKIHPNLLVEFNGRTSGHKLLVTGGIGLVQQIDDPDGNPCCFKNLIEIKEPNMTKLVLNRPVSGGDSGAWIITQGNEGNEWCGMVIGENRQSGYAIMSEDILQFLDANNYHLTCT